MTKRSKFAIGCATPILLVVGWSCAGCPWTDGQVWRTYSTVESLHPMTASAAQPFILSPAGTLPRSAKNIQFAFFCEWKAITDIIRFEASPEDCVATAEKWITDYKEKNPRTNVRGIRPLSDVTGSKERDDGVIIMNDAWSDPSTDPFKAPWFKPQNITEGLVAGDPVLMIWIDTKSGVFYYRFSD